MSKAFTRESDDAPDLPVSNRAISALPPGVKNYVTPAGADSMRQELVRLQELNRSHKGADANARNKPQAIAERILQLEQSLRTVVVVEPPPMPWEQVRFGATVRVRDTAGEESEYRIVGIDETDIDRDWVSWLSPVAKALINARIGQKIKFRVPAGERELEIVKISYD